MSCNSSWLGLAEAPVSIFDRLGAKPFGVVVISLLGRGNDEYHELTRCVMQLIPRKQQSSNERELRLHHVLFDFLTQSAEVLCTNEMNLDDCLDNDAMTIAPIIPYPGMLIPSCPAEELKSSSCWSVEKVEIGEIDADICIQMQCLYADPDVATLYDGDLTFAIKSALQGRYIMAKTSIVLSIESDENFIVAVVHSVNGSSDDKVAYRLGTSDTFQVIMTASPDDGLSTEAESTEYGSSPGQQTSSCPGYEPLAESIEQLLCLQGPASPSGLFLLGCAGVGKSRLLQYIRGNLQRQQKMLVHYVSLQEMLLHANSSSEESLLNLLMPTKYSNKTCWMIDDLDVLQLDEASEEHVAMDYERRLLLNCVLQAIDRLVAANARIIGAGQNKLRLPPSLLKAGRLEKAIEMSPPTQRQREIILCYFLEHIDLEQATRQNWSELLSVATAGCVAGDLHRMVADACMDAAEDEAALMNWDTWKSAARACRPSQLATLDVKKPVLYLENESQLDWIEIHQRSWERFRGFASLKKRIFRTVVAPWRRHFENGTALSATTHAISPPSGVLFHGRSGCGKTLAATCLGSSLGLPMIQVRAADVLDKWLGGSEEIIRSLFARARAASPCCLLFDELDSIANNRGTSGESTDVYSRLLSTLLNEMDGVSSGLKDNVLVVACTNRLDSLDAALLRPGRLEAHIELSLPAIEDTWEILQHQYSRIPLCDDVDLYSLATELVAKNASAADLEGITRESVFRCMRRESKTEDCIVCKADIMEAINVLKI
ncbi:hypothetical protein MPSEU_000086100 [Mayamaea pseudoterrestris]|nr:hypothetical protein MPSEU_000086100 [Mayamaea pseudoterrestris]